MDQDNIKKLSLLTRIGIKDEDIAGFHNDINNILDYLSKLSGISVSGDTGDFVPLVKNVTREDVVLDKDYDPQDLVRCTENQDGFIKVNKIL